MRLRELVILPLILMTASPAMASRLSAGSCPIDGYRCSQCEGPLVDKVNALMDRVKNPSDPNAITTVEEFLAQLPPELEKNKIVVSESKSVQETKPGNKNDPKDPMRPRILYKSPQAEVYIGYNTDPKSPNYNKLEMIFWDGKNAKFQFKELNFGKKSPDERVRHDASKDCVQCHTPSLRPNWDTYRAWAGVLPPRGDRLEPLPNPSTEAYLGFLQTVVDAKKSGKKDRLALLTIPPYVSTIFGASGSTETDPQKQLDELRKNLQTSAVQMPHEPPSGGDAATVNTFDQLSANQGCKISADLMDHPQYKTFKYALAASFQCQFGTPLEDFLPPAAKAKAEKHFTSKFPNTIRAGSVLQDLNTETTKSNSRLNTDKNQRHASFLKSAGFSDDQVKTDGSVDGVGESFASQVSNARYFLEPLGVRVSDWSMSFGADFTVPRYNFADVFTLPQQKAIQDVRDEFEKDPNRGGDFCQWAKKKSLAAFAEIETDPKIAEVSPLSQFLAVCSSEVPGIFPVEISTAMIATRMVLAAEAKRVLKENCLSCHADKNIVGSKRLFPFADTSLSEKGLRAWLNKTQAGTELTWLQVVERAIEHKGRDGVSPMPPLEDPLSKEHRAVLMDYLTAVKDSETGDSAAVDCRKINENLSKQLAEDRIPAPVSSPAGIGQ